MIWPAYCEGRSWGCERQPRCCGAQGTESSTLPLLAPRVPPSLPSPAFSLRRSKSTGSCAPVKTGGMVRMKESCREGVATRSVPEPCVDACKGVREASVGACAGRVLSRESVEGPERRRCRSRRKATPTPSSSRDVGRAPRGLRPRACAEPSHTGTGRSGACPRRFPRTAWGSPRT